MDHFSSVVDSYFIGAGRRGVNRAIKDTLLHEPENFIYLNNGITLVGNAVKPKGILEATQVASMLQSMACPSLTVHKPLLVLHSLCVKTQMQTSAKLK
ncbi:AIPR family protein [Escherichia coli]|nr:AIPR family protein [Escherichia coli]